MLKDLTSDKMKQKAEDHEDLKEAVDKEVKYLKGEGLDKAEIEEIQKIHEDQLDLEFILDLKEKEDDEESDEIENRIEREVYKTKEQKMEDFNNNSPNITMKYGGSNDVFQGIM